MKHIFDVNIAIEYGIEEAVILENLNFWITRNEANNENFYDGRYWTYNSSAALSELFPYMSQQKIKNALKHLRDEGIIIAGNYNKSAYDRTLWYALTDFGQSIVQNRTMESTNSDNGKAQSVQPIPYINTDINSNINTDIILCAQKGDDVKETKRKRFTPPSVQEVQEYCEERNNAVDAERFVDYYTATGWMVGKHPMKDWRAAVRTWERNGNFGQKAVSRVISKPDRLDDLDDIITG